jgi:hypothetical protein
MSISAVVLPLLLTSLEDPAPFAPPAYEPPAALFAQQDGGVFHGSTRFEAGFAQEDSPSGTLAVHLALLHAARPRTLVLWWESSAEGGGALEETFPVAATPTAVCAAEAFGTFLVAETSGNGAVRIVAYTFAPPSPRAMFASPESRPASLLACRTVCESPAAPPRRDIYWMMTNRGRSGHVFVLTWDARELFDLDLTTGTAVQVAGPTAESRGLVIPELTAPQSVCYAREHRTHGYLYFLTNDTLLPSGGTPILRDRDKDGSLDDALVAADVAAWNALGLGDPKQYVD